MDLDLDTITQPRTRWLDCGGVEFCVKYSSPKQSEQFRRGLIARGIARMNKGEFEVNPGREMDWFKALSEAYVLDWRGNIRSADPEKAKYSAERMADVMANHGGVLQAILKAITEAEDFFTSNGGFETKS